MAEIIPHYSVNPALTEQLLDTVFGTDRRARTAYAIRGDAPQLGTLSFVALDEDEHLVGSIEAYPIALTDPTGRAHPMVMIGPVAVLDHRRGEGFGKALMAACLAAIEDGFEQGAAPLPQVLIGDLDYYGRWDFDAQHTGGWRCPGPCEPERLLVRTGNPAVLPQDGMLGPWQG